MLLEFLFQRINCLMKWVEIIYVHSFYKCFNLVKSLRFYNLKNVKFCISDDDEFEPYDMSNDKEISKVKAPKYIRDCMEGKNFFFFHLPSSFCKFSLRKS